MSNGNTGHPQVIYIILCSFPCCYIIYTVVLVYYCSGRPSNTILPGALKFYVGFQNFTSEPLEHCGFVDPQGCSWRSPYQTQNNLDCLQIYIFQSQPSHRQEYCCPKFLCTIKTKYLSAYLSVFWSCLYCQTKNNDKERAHGRSPRKSSWLGRTMSYLYLDQCNQNPHRYNHWCLKICAWFHNSDRFFIFQCWKHQRIYLEFCGYMLWYSIPFWVYIQKQTSTSWHNQIFCRNIE